MPEVSKIFICELDKFDVVQDTDGVECVYFILGKFDVDSARYRVKELKSYHLYLAV